MGLSTAAIALAGAAYVALPAGAIDSVLARDADREPTRVAAFEMRETPVTRAEFRSFLAAHPAWQPRQVPAAFASAGYLQQGLDDDAPAPAG
ncbi:MAG: formylglycine-generating enzyme family protein, partial [Oxalobacteraceae bacterium]